MNFYKGVREDIPIDMPDPTSTFGSEFTACRQAVELLMGLHYKLWSSHRWRYAYALR